mgnify:CR=1 FL=1
MGKLIHSNIDTLSTNYAGAYQPTDSGMKRDGTGLVFSGGSVQVTASSKRVLISFRDGKDGRRASVCLSADVMNEALRCIGEAIAAD